MAAADFVMPTPEESLERTIKRCAENGIFLPTYEMLMNPLAKAPKGVQEELKSIGLWDVNPRNLFRITWWNEPTENGGAFQAVPNFVDLPEVITGVKARIIQLVGRWFPTGCHKVGASYGPIVERMVTGHFDPTCQKALWPSTGNYCRGGAFNSSLLKCPAIAVLPAQMSKERFEWLHKIGSEVYATPGCESSVKAVFDKNNQLVEEGKGRVVSLNQFADFANPLWHYNVTGAALEAAFKAAAKPGDKFRGVHMTQGSAGTLSSTEYLKTKFPHLKVAAGEATQCPTLLNNGFGDHRIEGIGDKHVPFILNCKNLDCVCALDDNDVIRTMHLFNQPEGKKLLLSKGCTQQQVDQLAHMGISSIANMIGCIKMAKMFEWGSDSILASVCTDSMAMYQSRLAERTEPYTHDDAVADYARLQALTTDNMIEMTYADKKRMHNLKYYTWVEQQGKSETELHAQWYDESYWTDRIGEKKRIELDAKITEFNKRSGMAAKYGL